MVNSTELCSEVLTLLFWLWWFIVLAFLHFRIFNTVIYFWCFRLMFLMLFLVHGMTWPSLPFLLQHIAHLLVEQRQQMWQVSICFPFSFFLSFFFFYKGFGPFINLLDGTIYIGNMCIECMKSSWVIKAEWKLKKVICLEPAFCWVFIFLYFQGAKIIFPYLFVKWIRDTVNDNI